MPFKKQILALLFLALSCSQKFSVAEEAADDETEQQEGEEEGVDNGGEFTTLYAETLDFAALSAKVSENKGILFVLFYRTDVCKNSKMLLHALDSVAKEVALQNTATIGAVDCGNVGGVGACEWLQVNRYPTYITFYKGKKYEYLEHLWTEYGDGTEIVQEQVTYLENKFFVLQPSEEIPKDKPDMLNLVVPVMETSMNRHPISYAFIFGIVLGTMAFSLYECSSRRSFRSLLRAFRSR
eukprot:m.336492 g.336492  ORF g.336492 m.336492 type:complete len:239 (+) comp17867_c0_seq1:202-918(+)